MTGWQQPILRWPTLVILTVLAAVMVHGTACFSECGTATIVPQVQYCALHRVNHAGAGPEGLQVQLQPLPVPLLAQVAVLIWAVQKGPY